MSALSNLYQEIIIDHAQSPKNFGELNQKSHHAHGDNPLCGDTIDIDLFVKNECVEEVRFRGDGCAISKASASLMTESIKGQSLETIQDLFEDFHGMLVHEQHPSATLKKLQVFEGVKEFPMRVKCATLCWHTLMAALEKKSSHVMTE
ncbi:MAG: SUF system NifU family Fe-S cluster assembly protein [Myxococcales bacterium]|nr:SUF system NifU family Fe-S cluster assembly protein [Myxococcales bacterium]USN50370.1 MAG: SUF system NifU family Fe-S cluster assembly protein [Myxococcales bacterium]